MINFRKIQEQVIYGAVNKVSNDEKAIYSKVLFEKAFACKVDVELLKSIKMGDDICLMKIIPRGTVWQ